MVVIKLLVIQICVILVASYSVGWLLSRFRQPQAVGEMVAGVLLGPSLLGWLAPGFFAALFPPASPWPTGHAYSDWFVAVHVHDRKIANEARNDEFE